MKLIMLPVLASLAFIGFEHKDGVIDLYRAAYPSDPVKREALEQCARIDPNFNRLDTIDRDHCYTALAGRIATTTSPSPSTSYAYNPSHLPTNDIRRQEANSAYGAGRAAASLMVPAVAREGRRANQ